jgi:hypothetical protein
MTRNIHERGVSILPLLQQLNSPEAIYLKKEEFRLLDSASLPPRTSVFVDGHPFAESRLCLKRSGSKLKITISTIPEEECPVGTARSAIMNVAFVEAARVLRSEGRDYRGYRQEQRVCMWTSRYQRGDAVLRLVDEEFSVIVNQAQRLLQDLADHHRG